MFENMRGKNNPIGVELIRKGLLTESQVERVLDYQKNHRDMKFAEIVDVLDMCDKTELLNVLASKLRVTPAFLEDSIEINPVDFLPRDVIINYRVLPFSIDGNTLSVAFSDPLDVNKVKEVELLLINQGYSMDIYVTLYTYIMKEISNIKAVGIKDINREEKDITKLIDNIILTAIEKRASDIHVEPMEDKVRIRYRIDGELITVSELPKARQDLIIGRLKSISSMHQEIRYDQDGSINTYENYSIRVSSQKNVNGEKFVLRLLKKNATSKTLFELGFKQDQDLLDNAINKRNSLIIVCAPTGEGKTTTLYSMLEYLDKPEINVVSIENPVERRLTGINQIEIGANITFASALRTVLRQDPDIILVGEIRDQETAKIAIESGQTGHLVLSTIHTIDAIEAITRLRKMGVSNYDISSTIATTVSQRLVRRLCQKCKREHHLTESEKRYLERACKISGSEIDIEHATFYEPVGCDDCDHIGYYERIALFEVLCVDEYLKDMIADNQSTIDIRQYAIHNTDYRPLVMDGIEKAMQGITSIEELKRKITL